MTSLLLVSLFVYALALGLAGPRLLRRFEHRQSRTPRLALALWITTTGSWVISVASLGLTATAQLSGGLGLAGVLHACLNALLTVTGVRDPAEAPAALALLCSLAFLVRLAVVAQQHVRRTKRHRRSHRREIHRIARTFVHRDHRVRVLEGGERAAYCLPGRRPDVVIGGTALTELAPEELDAVIAHERAHLRGKHHLGLGWAAVAARAFPFVPLLRSAPEVVARLLEWIADDRACRTRDGRTVARALAVMAAGTRASRAPAGALTATGSGVLERVTRLLDRERPAPSGRWPMTASLTVPVLALVVAVAVLVPAITADPTPLCAGFGR